MHGENLDLQPKMAVVNPADGIDLIVKDAQILYRINIFSRISGNYLEKSVMHSAKT